VKVFSNLLNLFPFRARRSRVEFGVPIYDPELPVSFHCPQCGKDYQLRGGEAEKQTPRDFLPNLLSFRCPGCQTVLKARIASGHWINDGAGKPTVFALAAGLG
jgi:predicted RNA-binding Zn-ribbon protein involved in translation (DUF1610 family)